MKIEFTLTDDGGHKYAGVTELMAVTIVNGQAKDPEHASVSAYARSEPKGLPDQIMSLREKGFFEEPRVPADVHAHLQSTYYCEPERVKVALLRLQRRRELRKTTKKIEGQDRVAYVW